MINTARFHGLYGLSILPYCRHLGSMEALVDERFEPEEDDKTHLPRGDTAQSLKELRDEGASAVLGGALENDRGGSAGAFIIYSCY